MKRILSLVAVAFMAASVSYGSSVTNTAKWNVPWGDIYRERLIETLEAYATQINLDSSTPSVSAVTLTGGSTIAGVATSTTSRTSVNIQPLASSTRAGVSRTSLVTIGDITGTNAFGFGVTNQSSYGLMAGFGRTIPATANWDGNYDTGVDFRCLNRLTNDAAYNLRGGYIKVKNYSGGVVGQMDGLTIEAVADGTETEVAVLKLGSDGSSVEYGIDMSQIGTASTADILFSEGATIRNTSSSVLTITEATVAIAGALTATTMAPANGLTTNVAVIIGAGTTSTFYFVSGILTNIAAQ
jgi:hypothetical protein